MTSGSTELERFLRKLKIEFDDTKLLKLALTHRSFGRKNNERLEFLGDAVLGFVISEKLYELYPEVAEGDLSRMRSSLVRRETLAELARANGFTKVLKLGLGELKSGGGNRDSVLADAFEALIGALMLDKGIAYTRQYLLRIYKDKINSIPGLNSLKDAKTQLQELLQARKYKLPKYILTFEKTDHPQQFIVVCKITELDIATEASGSSKRRAEQLAAAAALEKITND